MSNMEYIPYYVKENIVERGGKLCEICLKTSDTYPYMGKNIK